MSPSASGPGPCAGPGLGAGLSPSRGIDGSTTFLPDGLSPPARGLGPASAQAPGLGAGAPPETQGLGLGPGPGAAQTQAPEQGLPPGDPMTLSMEALNRGAMEATKAAKVINTHTSIHPITHSLNHAINAP